VRLVLDFDGTVTERDTLDLVLQRFGDAEVYERAEAELDAGRMTLNDVISAEFATVTAPLDEVVAHVVEHARVRPGFAALARARHPLVVSSGFHELIEPVLEREGLELAVVANRLDARPEGWQVRFRSAEPCPVCREPCKRADVAGVDPFVYVGDGFSDRCVALAASRVFARDGLADYLEARAVPFERFDDFDELARAL
jgi:2-hydroxy-3-keto-5-methylthiopentenyl-1-phosphate phosphatase